MISTAFCLLQSALLMLDAETAHNLALRGLKAGLVPGARAQDDTALRAELFGTWISNPVGLAAGFDKNAIAAKQLLGTGFGFVEIGTVTPRPQPGNPRPRVFRLPAAGGVINRYGFNNDGQAAVHSRLTELNKAEQMRVGANVGANKDSSDRIADYVEGVRAFHDVAGYLTINVSSPNTPGLRDLQAPDELRRLLSQVIGERDRIADAGWRRTAVIVKLAPDIDPLDLPAIVDTLVECGIDGVAISNTTISRPLIDATRDRYAREAGGLSGSPLFNLSTHVLARVYRLTEGKIPLIGIGGIDTGARAVAKIRAGATLIQLYTGLVYRGLPLLDDIKIAILNETRAVGVRSYSDLIGIDSASWSDGLGDPVMEHRPATQDLPQSTIS